MGKVNHHVKHLVRTFLDIAERDRRLHTRTLADGEAVVKVENIALKLGEIIVNLGEVSVILHTGCCRQLHLCAGQTFCLGDVGYNILAEAVNTHVQPEAHNVLDLLAHLGVCHVQVGLLFGEDMQIPLIELLVILPCTTLEQTVPVVGRRLFSLTLAPVVVIVIGIVLAFLALYKPRMLVGGMIDDKIHEHAQTALMSAVKHLLKDIEIAVIGVNIAIVGYIITVVGVRRGVKRRKPYTVNIQRGDVIELAQNAPKVAYTVTVAVAEASRPYLIDRHFLIPAFFLHSIFSHQCIMRIFYHIPVNHSITILLTNYCLYCSICSY